MPRLAAAAAGCLVVTRTRPARGELFIVSAPSGGGKTSLTRAAVTLLRKAKMRTTISVSYTTRARRTGERDGSHYHFVSDARFEGMVQRDAFLEHARVFGRRYGTGRAATERLLRAGTQVLLDIDWQGARQVRRVVPDAVSIFILPPSKAALRRRLRDRRQDDPAVVERRMRQARSEMRHYKEYDFLVVNRDFDRALAELVALIRARRLARPAQQARHKSLIQKLLS